MFFCIYPITQNKEELDLFKMEVDSELSLALVNRECAKDFFEIIQAQNAYLAEWMAWPPHLKELSVYEDYIKDCLHKYADGKSLICFIFYQDQPAGCIGFNTIDHDLRKVEIGYWLSQNLQGNGIVARCSKHLIQFAFERLNMDKVEIPVSEGNIPSRKVCERLGFVREGLITNAENLNGRLMDHVYYGLSRAKWKQT